MREPTPIFDELTARPPRAAGQHRLDVDHPHYREYPDPPTVPMELPAVATTQPEHVQTSHPHRKIGRLPKHTDEQAHPRLKLGDYLRGSYTGTVPNVVDHATQVTDWGMMLNDRLGDCTAADYGHGIELLTRIGQGVEVHPTDADVQAFYSGSTGYNPADPSTDQGGNMQDVCAYARKVGMAGHRIAAFFQVDPSNADQLRAALYLFGCVSIGMDFPAFAMDQTNAGQPWDVSRTNTKLEGGHDVLLVKMTKGGNYEVITWGQRQVVTPAFWAKYMAGRDGEAWARVSQDWVRNGTAAGNALTVDQLNAAFQQLTGQPGPFPGGTTPAPAPAPSPAPAPAPTPAPAPAGGTVPAPPADLRGFLQWLRDLLNKLLA